MQRNSIWLGAAIGLAIIAFLGARTMRQPALTPGFDLAPITAESIIEGDRFPTIINRPDGPPRLRTDLVDPLGQPVTIACATCHSIRDPNLANASTSDLDEFHQGLAVAHGDLTCLSCHNPDDYNSLKLASGQSVEYSSVMTLCAQCHGPQYRDYLYGAHGGMTGYWDLSRGSRQRNNCVDCHDAHAPAFPRMTPTFKPIDRFLHHEHASPPPDHD